MPIRVHLPDGRIVNFPDGMDQAAIAAEVEKMSAPPQAEAPQRPPAGGMLPTAGAFGGSLIGTLGGIPGRIAGAAAGGALGKGAEMFLDEKDDTLGESLRAMGQEGLKQGGFEAAGGMVGRGLKAIAPRLADLALNPIESVARKYPTLGQAYVREGKLFSGLRGGVGAVGKKQSTESARRLMGASRTKHDAVIAAADAAGAAPVSGVTVVRELRPIVKNASIAARTGKADARPAIRSRAKSFTQQNQSISNTEANTLRRSLDTSAEKAFDAERRLGQPAPLEAQMDKALAEGLRQAVRTNVPKSQAISARTKELAGLTKALDKAQTRKHLLTRTMGLSTGIAGSAAGALGSGGDPGTTVGSGLGTLGAAYLLTNPRHLGRVALGSHGLGNVAEAAPQIYRAALMAMLAQEPDE